MKKKVNVLLIVLVAVFISGCEKDNITTNEICKRDNPIVKKLDLSEIKESRNTFDLVSKEDINERLKDIKSSGYPVMGYSSHFYSTITNTYSHFYSSSELFKDHIYSVLVRNDGIYSRAVNITTTINGVNKTQLHYLTPGAQVVYGTYYCSNPTIPYSVSINSSGTGNILVNLVSFPTGDFYVTDRGGINLDCSINYSRIEPVFSESQSTYKVYRWSTLGTLDNLISSNSGIYSYEVGFNTNNGKFAIAHNIGSSSYLVVAYYENRVMVGAYHQISCMSCH